ncbi:hypothetical protein EV122DRAFT_269486 [Schizophyllum commune]
MFATVNSFQPYLRNLTWASLVCSACVLGASLVSQGIQSFFLAPVAGFFTLLFHFTIIIMQWRDVRSRAYSKYSTLTALVIAYLLAALWAAAFAVIGWLFVFNDYYEDYWHNVYMGLAIAQLVLAAVEDVLMWMIAARATIERQHGVTRYKAVMETSNIFDEDV